MQHINRRDAAAGFRLACMLRVRDDLAVQVPADVLEAGRWRCRPPCCSSAVGSPCASR